MLGLSGTQGLLTMTERQRAFVHIFFMDGVGLGGPDADENPFVSAAMPALTSLLGEDWYLNGRGRVQAARGTLIPTDANLGVAGRPQSATGQATILIGRDIPREIGEHYGPKPNVAVIQAIRRGTLFQEVVAAGKRAALITPYPAAYFKAIESGRRMLSAIPLAATEAGLPLMGEVDLRAGRAVSPDFTSMGWRDQLGYEDMPLLSLGEAGHRIAAIAASNDFSFFEHWPSDHVGHRGTMAEAIAHLERLDTAIGGVLEAWDDSRGLLIITSDHGNLEEKGHRQHTRNPVPTILVGHEHAHYAERIHDLSDIATVVREVLGLPQRS